MASLKTKITPYKAFKAAFKKRNEIIEKTNPITGKPKLTVVKGGLYEIKKRG
jgi:hypothetical protein